MLIPFPSAFLVGAFLSDLAYLRKADAFWARASQWLVGAGLVSGALAAVFGLIDFLSIKRARGVIAGWIHLIGNAAALVLSLVNLVIRLRNPFSVIRTWGLALSAITNGLLVLTGWMGGELAYHHMIGVTGDIEEEQAITSYDI
jgi:uncharacterized membrane protein